MRNAHRNALGRAKRLRHASTAAESALWDRLRDRQVLGLKFRRQAPVGPYIADFFCHELRLVLEIDGGIHAEERQISHDANRDANLQALGYRVLCFTNQQIEQEIELVLGSIRRLKLKRTVSPLSRKGAWEDGREGPGE